MSNLPLILNGSHPCVQELQNAHEHFVCNSSRELNEINVTAAFFIFLFANIRKSIYQPFVDGSVNW